MFEQHRERNLSMVMDFYELTMSNGYFRDGVSNARVAFDVFYRKNPDNGGFAIFAGLAQVVEYIRSLHFTEDDIAFLRAQGIFDEGFLDYLRHFRFTGDLYALREGTVMYPNTPVVTVVAPLIEAQIVETAILLEINHQSLIATKANRIVRAAQGRVVSDFGARRAHNIDSAVYGARASYIGGVDSTATVLAGSSQCTLTSPTVSSVIRKPSSYSSTTGPERRFTWISSAVTCGGSERVITPL